MNKIIAIILCLLSLFTHADEKPMTRQQLDNKNKQTFEQLNFLHEGLGMHISPGLIIFADVREKLSKYSIRQNSFVEDFWGVPSIDGKLVGVFNEKYKGMQIGALGCVACHSGKAAGEFIIGLGNKNIDVGRIGRDVHNVELLWKFAIPNPGPKNAEYRRIEKAALDFSKDLADEKYTNLTQGLVPTSMIRKWFYRQSNMPIPEDMPRAQVKVPALFGYKEKRAVGQFCDGGGQGKLPGWGIAVELAAGQTAENVKTFVHKIEMAEDVIGDFLPPKYPFKIDRVKAEKGKEIFNQTCVKCHGEHEFDEIGLPKYTAPKIIPWKVVKTDHDRLDQIEGSFLEAVAKNPLKEIIQATEHRDSYFAPKLFGIWARFPYLHNGSVPNIYDLLSAAQYRPKAFSLKEAGERHRFDSVNLGLKAPVHNSAEELLHMKRGEKGRRSIFDTRRPGHSNVGHEFYIDLKHEDKMKIIEYLKTL